MQRTSIEKEIVAKNGRRPNKLAISLAGMGLGDRIILEAPLRAHRANFPDDHLIAIDSRNGGPDLPRDVRRHFDEIWWVSTADGSEWSGLSLGTVDGLIRDRLIAESVNRVVVPMWRARQIPRDVAYTKDVYSCFVDAEKLRTAGIYPRLTVGEAEEAWARGLLAPIVAQGYDALVAIHPRRVWFSPERNIDPDLVRQIIAYLRGQGRFGFLLIGRDDGAPSFSGPDVFALMGRDWAFEQTAAVIAQTGLFIGGESGLTHAAAALGVPLVAINYFGDHAIPFADPKDFVWFRWGESPEQILAGVRRFARRLETIPAGRS